MSSKVRIGSRGSDLALWQAHFFQSELKRLGVASEIIIIKTQGDRIQHLSFDKLEGKGFFTKEIEAALLTNEIDIAIHSHKDLETLSPPGLTIAGVSEREDPSELLLVRKECADPTMHLGFKRGAIVGTSSARRKSQIMALRPDIALKDIRGNVPTRIDKLRSGKFDAILLAFAGVHRLGLDVTDLFAQKLDPRLFIPAPAQGVLAYQCRAEDSETIALVQKLSSSHVQQQIDIERGILRGFGGGCQIPIGVHAMPIKGAFEVRVSYGNDWQATPARVRFEASDYGQATRVFDALRTSRFPKSVFYSSDASQESFLRRAVLSQGAAFTAKSLIETSPLKFEADPDRFDWVVFSSSRAVDAFFMQENPRDWLGKQLAVAGESTARTLSKFGIEPAFVGSGSDMSSVAQHLAEVIGLGTALFAGSSRGLMSLEQFLPEAQRTSIQCYHTAILNEGIPEQEAYIFTSPSNVLAFMKAGNVIASDAVVVAIGPSTSKALGEHGLNHRTASIPAEPELFALLASDN